LSGESLTIGRRGWIRLIIVVCLFLLFDFPGISQLLLLLALLACLGSLGRC
jgi:hypothetical protein